jgi:hypothetical protein
MMNDCSSGIEATGLDAYALAPPVELFPRTLQDNNTLIPIVNAEHIALSKGSRPSIRVSPTCIVHWYRAIRPIKG